MAKPKPAVVGVFGARGTGKTQWSKRAVRASGFKRVMVWDYKHDSGLADLGEPFKAWPEFVRACKQRDFVARYLVDPDLDPHEQFAAFCALAWREGNLLMFVDELAEVTKASRAPAEWRKCVNVGRDYANGTKCLSIIGASQRPTEVDKSFIGNADVIHTGRLGYANDCKALASMWGCDAAELSQLPNLHWIEKRADSAELVRGVLSLTKEDTKKQPERRALGRAS